MVMCVAHMGISNVDGANACAAANGNLLGSSGAAGNATAVYRLALTSISSQHRFRHGGGTS